MGTMMSALLLACELMALDASVRSVSTFEQRFEVASIKRCQKSGSPNGDGTSPDRLHLACVTTANLIRLAYLV
jgi:hypothetical protein